MKAFVVLAFTVLAYFKSAEAIECNQWTKYYSRDHPSGNADYEALALIRGENPNDGICEVPSHIEAKTIDGVDYKDAGEVVHISPTFGFYCTNSEQPDGSCLNYKVRFCCLNEEPTCTGQWTNYYNRDGPSGSGDWETIAHLRAQHPNQICADPSAIDARLVSNNADYRTGNDVVGMSPFQGLWCVRSVQTDYSCNNYKIRFCCPAA